MATGIWVQCSASTCPGTLPTSSVAINQIALAPALPHESRAEFSGTMTCVACRHHLPSDDCGKPDGGYAGNGGELIRNVVLDPDGFGAPAAGLMLA
jgi:hypothetical protein